TMVVDVAVAGVEEMQRLAGDELEATTAGDVARRRQRIEAALAERLCKQLRLARPGREAAVRERPPVFRPGQPRVAILPEPLERDSLEPRMTAGERRAEHRFVALEEPRLRPAERRRQATEQLGVAHRLAERRDRRAIEGEVQMSPGGREIEVLDLACR